MRLEHRKDAAELRVGEVEPAGFGRQAGGQRGLVVAAHRVRLDHHARHVAERVAGREGFGGVHDQVAEARGRGEGVLDRVGVVAGVAADARHERVVAGRGRHLG